MRRPDNKYIQTTWSPGQKIPVVKNKKVSFSKTIPGLNESIDDLIDQLHIYKAEGWQNLFVEHEDYYTHIYLTAEHPATSEELTKWEEYLAANNQKALDKKRKEYERLKRIFES